MYNSVYSVRYDYDSQSVLLEDLTTQVVSLVEFNEFVGVVQAYFDDKRTNSVRYELTSGREMVISFVAAKIGFKDENFNFFKNYYQKALSPNRIEFDLTSVENDVSFDRDRYHESLMGLTFQ